MTVNSEWLKRPGNFRKDLEIKERSSNDWLELSPEQRTNILLEFSTALQREVVRLRKFLVVLENVVYELPKEILYPAIKAAQAKTRLSGVLVDD